jgi:glycosyl hydrolase family 20
MRVRLALMVLAFANVAARNAVAEAAIWPPPREAQLTEDRLLLTDAAIVVPEGDRRAQLPGRLLAELIQDHFQVVIPVVVGTAPEGKTPISVGLGSPTDPGPEGYLLKVDDSGVRIAGSDQRGTLYGVSSFVQLVHAWGHRSVAAWKGSVRDWPFLKIRWVHVYLPGREELPFARRYLRDFLLRYKFNGLVLEVGGGMRLTSHPEISTGWRRTVAEWYAHGETIGKLKEGIPLGAGNRFAASCHFGVAGGAYVEKEDVRQFAELAEDYGLEIVPEVQGLSHAYYIASARRDLAEIPDMPWPDSYCPSNPESYRVLFDVMDEYLDVLHSKRVHIGHDEWRAGAFCPRCRGQDPGRLYAEDVLRIRSHLAEKGIEVWMWGDHFVDEHNRFGKSWTEGTAVRYERPDTSSARDRIAAEANDIHILNWSGEKGDRAFQKLGWPFIVGNLEGSTERDWAGRVARSGLLGGEVSSWGALEEFQLGKLQIPEALYSIGLLWSASPPKRDEILERLARLLPDVRGRLAARPLPSFGTDPMRFEVLDLGPAFNHPPKGEGWDLSGLKTGEGYAAGLPYSIADPANRGGRSCVLATRDPQADSRVVELGINGRWASLVFLQAATAAGRPTVHAGDATHFPHESSELLGFYEIRFADGLVAVHEIRYDETAGRWDAGLALPSYFARSIVAGALPDGRKAVLWASEWPNRRPDVPIASVRLIGSPGPSSAQPILFGVTGVEKPRVEDLR